MADHYLLRVTAGPTYTSQSPIPINASEPTTIDSEHCTAHLRIRIQNFRGLPSNTPSTSPYFDHPAHTSDRYSLEFNFTPKKDYGGQELVLGNDFDHPIKDKLPPGFNQAFSLVKWFVDPGLYGDVYSDEPYLYGPLLSSINVLRVGEKREAGQGPARQEGVLTEGAEGEGEEARQESGMPGDAAARKKHFLDEANLKDFKFDKGREYGCDFFNPYLDFNDFSLKLPGWGLIPGVTIPIISYWDGQPLRYVLKDRTSGDPLFVVIFTLVPKEQVEQEVKDAAESGAEQKNGEDID